MDAFVRMSVRDRRLACLKVTEQKRLQPASVDKDFWVCWTLREMFSLPDIGSSITFKGGTSLSKAWGLIERFSEDIDLVVDKDALGFAGEASPDQAPSNKQRRRRLEDLMAACRIGCRISLKPALEQAIAERFGTREGWHLEVDPDMADGQCLLFHYPSAFPADRSRLRAAGRQDRTRRPLRRLARRNPAPSRPMWREVLPQAIPDATFLRVHARARAHLLGKSHAAA